MPDPVRWGPDKPHHSVPDEDIAWSGMASTMIKAAAAAAWTWPERLPRAEDRDGGRSPGSEALASGQTTFGELSTTVREDFRNRLIGGENSR